MQRQASGQFLSATLVKYEERFWIATKLALFVSNRRAYDRLIKYVARLLWNWVGKLANSLW